MNINEFKQKKVWAVVGSVSNKEKFAYKIYNFLKMKGYKVYAVDPKGLDVDGEKSYTSLLELPEVPEAVDMVINPVRGVEYVEQAKQLDVKYIWFQPGAENLEIVEKAKGLGMEVVYDHCVMKEF
ncbi:hypothetical protein ABG79_00839 [Caloramator mitchellensis]|uniref:CoA-binding domain-containing protein n=1 Tax=Caloramator mitchellensis TaxID=908809 RepID=A0A0R3K2F6_CALMK|nr:CoA-binding protein [Caloramator mitchellensis]KRQ87500.1 hypothetical protein ABG79_00839 [Caloramator mitchellensis]